MDKEVVHNPKGMYENADIIIVSGKDSNGELNFLVHDKRTRETMPLGACLWCNKELS